MTDYSVERNTIIEDGSFSILSIFPIGITNNDAKSTLLKVKEKITNGSKKTDFIKRTRECAVGDVCGEKYTDKKSIHLLHCSCFDVVDSFVIEKSTISRKTKSEHKYDIDPNRNPNLGIRVYIGTTYSKWSGRTIRIDIFLKIFTRKNVGILNFNISIDGLTVEQTIALRHVVEGKVMLNENMWRPCFSPNEADLTCKELVGGALFSIFNVLKQELAPDKKNEKKHRKKKNKPLTEEIVSYNSRYSIQTILELRTIGKLTAENIDAHTWACKHAQMIYGLVTGDEGIGFIPEELALGRLSNHWGSRDFLDMIAVKNNVIVLNTKTTSQVGKDYIAFQNKWNDDHNGGEKRLQYFSGKPCMAGFDHGILNAVERNIVIKYYYEFINQQNTSSSKKLNQQRQQLISFINSSLSTIQELDEMYNVISKATGIDKSIEQVRNKLNIQSEEMNIDYQLKNNGIIMFLTIVSLIVAIIAIEEDTIFLHLKIDNWTTSAILIILILAILIISVHIVTLYFANKRE